jgi:DNA-binding NarL/FixJ family response regulator
MPPVLYMSEISVLLVDDHSLVRKGFRRILEDDSEIRVVGEACDGVEAVKVARELKPQVIVMDMAMPGLNGMQACIEILKVLPNTAILMLSMYSEENYVRNALDAGAKGYILKDAMDIDLASAVKQVAAGQKVIAQGLLSSTPDADADHGKLTNRERQILQLIAEGKSNKEIAILLDLSVNTVSVHRANLMEALGIHRTAELVLYAVRKGLVQIP